MKNIIVQVGIDRVTGMPLYQVATVATLAGGSQDVYVPATGTRNEPCYLSVALARLAAMKGV